VKVVHLKNGPFPSHKIYISDTGLSTVNVPPKIIAPKGIKQLDSMTFGERGRNIILIAAVITVRNHLPPNLVFPRVRFKRFMLRGALIGSKGVPTHLDGLMNYILWSS
jgi:hypothetical protein